MNNVGAKQTSPVFRALSQPPSYRIHRAPPGFDIATSLDPARWRDAALAELDSFHPSSTSHRPLTTARVLYDDQAIHVRFDVKDRFVRSTHLEHQSRVSQDSCVEFFIQPASSAGYFNFELNAGGVMLVYFIEDPTRGENGTLFRRFTELPVELLEALPVAHTLPRRVEPEIQEQVDWSITFSIPFTLIERYAPGVGTRRNRPWRGNFHKCGDHTSHPHWASWADIGETLRFHQPDRFGTLTFESI